MAFYSGAFQLAYVDFFEELNALITMADPFFFTGVPITLESKKALTVFLHSMIPIFKRLKINKSTIYNLNRKRAKFFSPLVSFLKSDVFVGDMAHVQHLDLAHLKGKMLITDYLSPEFEEKLKQAQVDSVLVLFPLANSTINYSVLEAMLFLRKRDDERVLHSDDVMDFLLEKTFHYEWKSFATDVNDIIRFSFVVHPLNVQFLFKHPLLKPLKNFSQIIGPPLESLMSFTPGVYYGKIAGIVSEKTGQRAEGLIYTISETPKKLLDADPDVIYKKIGKLCDKAHRQGSKIMGLGAYTKIVGDAGVTIDHLSPIPVTTGNSLSSASTLWAANLAVKEMGFVPYDAQDFFTGVVMVVGATGSIGAVLSKILSFSWKKVILVAPRVHKLMELKHEIEVINPKALLEVSTDVNRHLHESDLIITSTSGVGKVVLDILKVKSGAVICDVSRPFDISEKEAILRPDVLIVASGEVTLPGVDHVAVDLGLAPNLVYACLAETALLALDKKFEAFTLSRRIDYKSVLEIDRLAKEHGVRLSQIMGHNGVITEKEIALCRQHAQKK